MEDIYRGIFIPTVSSNINPAPSNKRKADTQETHKNQSKRLNTISAMRELDTSHSSFISGTNFSLPAKPSAPLQTVIQSTLGPDILQPNTLPKHFQSGANDLDIYRNGLPEQNALYPLSPTYLNNISSTEGSVSAFNSTPTIIDPELAFLNEILFFDQGFNYFPLASPDIQHTSNINFQTSIEPNPSNSYIPGYASSIFTEIPSTPLSSIPSDINDLPQTISPTTLSDSSHNQDLYVSPPRWSSKNNVQSPIYIDGIETPATPPIEKNTPIQLLHSASETEKTLVISSDLLNASQEIQDGIVNILENTKYMDNQLFKNKINEFMTGKWYKDFLYEEKKHNSVGKIYSEEFKYIITCINNAIENYRGEYYISPNALPMAFGFSKPIMYAWAKKYSIPQITSPTITTPPQNSFISEGEISTHTLTSIPLSSRKLHESYHSTEPTASSAQITSTDKTASKSQKKNLDVPNDILIKSEEIKIEIREIFINNPKLTPEQFQEKIKHTSHSQYLFNKIHKNPENFYTSDTFKYITLLIENDTKDIRQKIPKTSLASSFGLNVSTIYRWGKEYSMPKPLGHHEL